MLAERPLQVSELVAGQIVEHAEGRGIMLLFTIWYLCRLKMVDLATQSHDSSKAKPKSHPTPQPAATPTPLPAPAGLADICTFAESASPLSVE